MWTPTILTKIRRGIYCTAKAIYKKIDNSHSYLENVTGLIHVGANLGQERALREIQYQSFVGQALARYFRPIAQENEPFPSQTAVNHLVTDKDHQICI